MIVLFGYVGSVWFGLWSGVGDGFVWFGLVLSGLVWLVFLAWLLPSIGLLQGIGTTYRTRYVRTKQSSQLKGKPTHLLYVQ